MASPPDRRTGVSQLRALGADVEMRALYFGHAPATIREIHYEQDSPEFQAQFDGAIDALDRKLGIVK